MRGWTSIFLGLLLLAVAVWTYPLDGFGSATLVCGVAAAFFLIRGAQGAGAGDAGDPTALVDFVTDPAGAIVDTATDRLGDWYNNGKSGLAGEVEQPKFDADAAIARYMARRGSESSAATAVPTASDAPARSFGRKRA
jgi:hypothetical protein